MRIKLFREKLSYEVNEAANWIQEEGIDQRIQANLYCIAALLRKILSRVDRAERIKVSVRERGTVGATKASNISLPELNDAFIHYARFVPSLDHKQVNVLGDEDDQLNIRELEVSDFLENARRIAEDGEVIVNGVLRYAKKQASKVSRVGVKSRVSEEETFGSLIDIFDLIRELGREAWVEGSVTMFSEQRNPKNLVELFGIETAEIEYEILFRHLFVDWSYIPFRQFRAYEDNDFGLGLQGKSVMTIESHASYTGKRFMASMRLEDIVALLHKMEHTPYSSPYTLNSDRAPRSYSRHLGL